MHCFGGIIWFIKSSYIHDQFTQLFTWLPFETIEKGISYLFGYYLIYSAIIVTILFTVSLFSEPLIKHIEEEHFPDDEIVRDNVFKSIRYTLKDALIFTVISILVFPLLFIPFVNFLIQLGL